MTSVPWGHSGSFLCRELELPLTTCSWLPMPRSQALTTLLSLCRKSRPAHYRDDLAIRSGTARGGPSPEFCSLFPSITPEDTKVSSNRLLDKHWMVLPIGSVKTATGCATKLSFPPLPTCLHCKEDSPGLLRRNSAEGRIDRDRQHPAGPQMC